VRVVAGGSSGAPSSAPGGVVVRRGRCNRHLATGVRRDRLPLLRIVHKLIYGLLVPLAVAGRSMVTSRSCGILPAHGALRRPRAMTWELGWEALVALGTLDE
jgi:hypothetical protein